MEDYPVSCQDYALFHFDEPFEQTEYCKQLDQPLNSKSILILTKSKASLPRVKRLVKAARIAGLEVYVREYFAKAFADNKHVHPVEKTPSHITTPWLRPDWSTPTLSFTRILLSAPGRYSWNKWNCSQTAAKPNSFNYTGK